MRLSNATLDRLPSSVEHPAYDRSALKTGIVHLGIGAFHRAHQAVYTDRLLAGDPRWGILGVSLRSPDTRDALAPQDGLHTVAVADGSGIRYRVVGASTGLAVAPEDPAGLVARLADPDTRIVTLTVTEKGYCHDPATGALRLEDPGIRQDLADLSKPRTAIGFLAAGLKTRREAGLKPFTVLTCDNLPANGETVRGLVHAFARELGPGFADWVEGEVRFPCTMVDRIVPATTDADRTAVDAALGLSDAWPVMTEPFSQWVVEDDFTLGRPAWDSVGVEFVRDVKPFELMKLRLLNGSHSTLAYLGYLMGHETVSAAMGEPALARLIERLMAEESGPTVPAPAGFDVAAYQRDLLARFRNPALKHRTWQIAMDGSQKLPQRLLGTVRDRLAAGQPITVLTMGVAAWMRYVTGIDEKGQPIDVRDPLAARMRSLAESAGPNAGRLAPALLGVTEVFGELAEDPRFRAAVESALGRLYAVGARQAVVELVAG